MEKSKKYKGLILAAAAVLCIGAGAAAYAYAATQVRPGAPAAVSFAGQTAAPAQSSWSEPVLGGLLEKTVTQKSEEPVQDLGIMNVKTLPLEAEESGEMEFTVSSGDTVVFQGTPEEYQAFAFSENGAYRGELSVSCPADETRSQAEFIYEFSFILDVQPKILFSSDRALQGDILAVYVNKGFEAVDPSIETDFGTAVFLPLSEDEYVAYVPVNYAKALGQWKIKVALGEIEKEQSVIVTARNYAVQHMTISQETTDSTMNNPEGPVNWAERIKVLWDTYDTEKYWTERFIQPCEAKISTQFGLYRYTNENPNPSRHTGIDIAAAADTPVQASNAGRVVRAESIIYTGNTVAIEHGGGLKTYYYHMNSLEVKEGDMVKKGQIIGTVGSTGYSTGAHLHFEVKIGTSSLSPWELFDGTSEIYFLGE
jgi:murein DD-endopeptidase MepM/ murein hydrolase activator NlpD